MSKIAKKTFLSTFKKSLNGLIFSLTKLKILTYNERVKLFCKTM